MSGELHIVGFRIGRESYGVPITSLHEIVRVPEITAVPDAPDYMEGVINLRGKIVSVLDLRKRLGETQAASNKRNRILVVEHKGRLSGLIVVTGLGKYQGRLIVLLDMPKLLEASASGQKGNGGEDKPTPTATSEVRRSARTK
jgi:purine-binding chemotaxis protein CheW